MNFFSIRFDSRRKKEIIPKQVSPFDFKYCVARLNIKKIYNGIYKGWKDNLCQSLNKFYHSVFAEGKKLSAVQLVE